MKSDNYKDLFQSQYLMGPNSVRILDELLETYPLKFTREQKVLDLGCGTGFTSLYIGHETGATVYANDLWIPEEENRKRFDEWEKQEFILPGQLIPVHEDANNLQFEKEMFDAVISIDAYHYFGGKEGFFAQKILPFIKPGGVALIAVPGMKNEYDGRSEELMSDWLNDEAYMFQSPKYWKEMIGNHEDIEELRIWEMQNFELAWQEWFATGHEYALGDFKFYENLIKPYTAFVGMMVKKKV